MPALPISPCPVLYTDRLLLRPWRLSDGESLYLYAKDPAVGPVAGWPVHQSVSDSREVIQNVLSKPGCYAVTLKEADRPVGAISLCFGKASNLDLPANEAEIGYWIGVPYWGRGLIPEAVRAVQRHAFMELNAPRLWCGYFDGNEKSKRAQEKCGFRYIETRKDIFWPVMGDIRTEHITRITREEWERLQAAPMGVDQRYLTL